MSGDSPIDWVINVKLSGSEFDSQDFQNNKVG